jgi:hypothetical protein
VLYLRRDEIAGRRLLLFLAVTAVVQLALVAQRTLAPLFPTWPFCQNCEFLNPTDVLADKLAAHGWSRATIWVEHDTGLGGNLRVYLPLAQVRTRHLDLEKALPARDNGEHCMMIVEAASDPTKPITANFPPAPAGYASFADPPEKIIVPWAKHIAGAGRTTSWIVQPLRDDDPRCTDKKAW